MRHEPNLRVDNYRDNSHPAYQSEGGKNWGAFRIPGEFGTMTVISSGSAHDNPDGLMWEHVSVSYPRRCPSWKDMDKVKRLFWADDETVVQFHPRLDAKINLHEFTLHLWKRGDSEFELPPTILI